MEAFGPYRMDRPEYEYGLAEFGQEPACPTGHTCDGDFDTELLAKSAADVERAQVTQGKDFDFRFLLHAGYDESGVWQELGEMRFPTRRPDHRGVRQPRSEQAELVADAVRRRGRPSTPRAGSGRTRRRA